MHKLREELIKDITTYLDKIGVMSIEEEQGITIQNTIIVLSSQMQGKDGSMMFVMGMAQRTTQPVKLEKDSLST